MSPTEELTALREEVERLKGDLALQREQSRAALEESERGRGREMALRIAAQRGLLDTWPRRWIAFKKRLLKDPLLAQKVRPLLEEVNLWAVQIAYDPQNDPGTSVVSVQGPLARQRGKGA